MSQSGKKIKRKSKKKMEAYENDAPEEMLLFWHFVVNFVLGTSSFSPLAVTSCVWAGVR